MKNVISLFVLLVILMSQQALSQEKVAVKVKGSEIVTGVVIVHVQKDAKSIDLQCNEGAFGCTSLASGNYMMVELPKNYGMYDCKNVEIYRGDQDKPEAAEKVGSYCLVEK